MAVSNYDPHSAGVNRRDRRRDGDLLSVDALKRAHTLVCEIDNAPKLVAVAMAVMGQTIAKLGIRRTRRSGTRKPLSFAARARRGAARRRWWPR